MKKGISLIILVITIIVILILASAIILSISQNNPIVSAQEARFKATLQEYNSELTLVLSQKYAQDSTFNPYNFSANTWDGNLLNINGTVRQYITNISAVDGAKYMIVAGKLIYVGTVAEEKTYSQGSGIQTSKTDFDYSGDLQVFYANQTGRYKVELWGAQGGGSGGKGGYTSGEISLNAGTYLAVFVGSTTSTGTGGYNGGGTITKNVYGGGGATDIRLTIANWDDITSLRSRIMVAAGGGGMCPMPGVTVGGYAGGLTGGNGTGDDPGQSGKQTIGGSNWLSTGTFGKGGNGYWYSEIIGGGGSGYYGGSSEGGSYNNGSGGGGSSFISGYTGCNAINSSGVHTGQPNHFSGYVFTNSQMIDGNSVMTSPTGSSETGHTGNGYARITYLGT